MNLVAAGLGLWVTMISLVLLLLGSSVCAEHELYGTTHRMQLNSNAHSIEFKSKDNSKATVLWNRNGSAPSNDSRRQVIGSYYVIRNLTQRDSGEYIIRDRARKALSRKTIEVKENTRLYRKYPDEKFNFTFDLEPNSCNMYFYKKSDEQREILMAMIRRGRLQEGLYQYECPGFELLKPCGILNKALQKSCEGRLEVIDQNNDLALEVVLEIDEVHKHPLYTFIGVGASVAALICCCCVKCCCCGKRSSEKNGSEAAAEPAVNFHEYNTEPVAAGQDQVRQPSMTLHPAVPSYTSADPLVHDSLPVNIPPHSEVSAPAKNADATTVPLFSDNEPRFELKGLNFLSTFPLNSDSTHCDVYTSDKLSFK